MKEEIYEKREDSFKLAKCCRSCKHSRAGWDTLTCYIIPDNIHKENNYLKTVHPEYTCDLWEKDEEKYL